MGQMNERLQNDNDLAGRYKAAHLDYEAARSALAKQETRQEKMERLAKEYEESVQAAKDEGCLMCGS